MVNPTSFANITSKWIPELKLHCPNTPIVLVGTKNDLLQNVETLKKLNSKGTQPVTDEEAINVCKKHGLGAFISCSSYTQNGLKEVFEKSIYLVLNNRKYKTYSKKEEILIAPILPKAGKAPWIHPETNLYDNDLRKLLNSSQYSDVSFFIEDQEYFGHRMILFATDPIREILMEKETSKYFEIKHDEKKDKIIVNEMKPKVFEKFLEFLYVGIVTFEEKNDEIPDLIEIAKEFKLDFLNSICVNQKNGDTDLNPSIGTWLNDKTAEYIKDTFFNKKYLSDIEFIAEKKSIPAHKLIISTRCDVLNTMLSNAFKEGSLNQIDIDIPYNIFLSFLEYLYTSHVTIESSDSASLLMYSNQYGISRLVTLCEIKCSKLIEESITENIQNSTIDIIGLLKFSKDHNANQLYQFLLHFISTNYQPMSKRKDFKEIDKESMKYIEENQWPPKSYLKEMEEYERKMKQKGSNCSLM